MKFEFNCEIKGLKKNSENGSTKIFEGGHMNFSCEAEVSEIVQIMRDRQISLDKVLNFVKVDLPQSIKDCGHSLIQIERENRLLNNELPSRSRKQMQEENNALHERIEKLEEALNDKEYQLDSSMRDCKGTSEALEELQKKFDELNHRYNFLKKKYLEENNEDPKVQSWDNL